MRAILCNAYGPPEDLALAEETGVPAPVKKRLKFDEAKLSDVTEELTGLMALPDPLRNITLARELDQGLTLYRVTCPIGVIGVIFEARPDALVQISSLCLKSGNCAILKGGKETTWTNRVLFSLIHQAAIDAGLARSALEDALKYVRSFTRPWIDSGLEESAETGSACRTGQRLIDPGYAD